jgi:hypothetical protein
MISGIGLLIGAIGLAWPAVAAPATPSDELCERLFLPEGYGLGCSLEVDPSGSGEAAAVVRPTDSAFAPLSELSLRRVEEPVDDSAEWLRQRLRLDLSQLDLALAELTRGEDSPITGTPLADQLDSWRQLLGPAAALPLTGCGEPAPLAGGLNAWEMACAWELGPLRQYMRFRLVERAGERYAIQIRTMNEQRLRHLVAIANSF